jgi:hypothetical protein
MKKLSIFAVVFAAVVIASCGGKKSAQNVEENDSTKSFEQTQIEASIKMHFDSLATELGKLKNLPFAQDEQGKIVLSKEEKQVKPDYLLDPAIAENATTLAEKYRALVALQIDKQIASLYELSTDEFDKSITKLVADINDPSFKVFENTNNLYETSQALYDAMNENGRINYFWQMAATSLVEQFYVASQKADSFLAAFDDEAAANSTFRFILLKDAIERLQEYDPEIAPVAEALQPLDVLNATTVAELKTQLQEAKEPIAAAREALIK